MCLPKGFLRRANKLFYLFVYLVLFSPPSGVIQRHEALLLASVINQHLKVIY